MALMLLGALLAIGGLVQTTSSHFADQSCPEGTNLIAKFTYDHGYSFDSPSGNSLVVTLSHTSASGGDWSSTQFVSYVIVKGGPSAVMTTLTPAQKSGHFSNAGLPDVGHENKPDISSVQFCGSAVPPSSSSSTSTSTTCQCSTSTSLPPTSTTNCGCSTTSVSTSTTCECTSTTTTPVTEPHVTTTTKESTTTSTSTTSTSTTTTTEVTPPTQAVTESTTTTSTTVPVTDTTKVAGTTVVKSTTSTTEHGQGATTTTAPVVTSTTVLTPTGTKLPFTGGQSGPLLVLGILFLASGAALTLSSTRGRRGSRA